MFFCLNFSSSWKKTHGCDKVCYENFDNLDTANLFRMGRHKEKMLKNVDDTLNHFREHAEINL